MKWTQPMNILEKWMAGINTVNLPHILELYSDSAILLPTFSNRFLAGKTDLEWYFKQLSLRKNLHVDLHRKTYHEQKLHDGVRCMSGIYRWQFDVDEELLTFEARFSYTVDLNLSAPIIHHHSSQVPRML